MTLSLVGMVATLVISVFMIWRAAGQRGYAEERMLDLLLVVGFTAVIVAHLTDVVVSGSFTLRAAFSFWQGGYLVYGGILGALAALFWGCRRFGWSLYEVGDLMVPGLLVLLAGSHLSCTVRSSCAHDTALIEGVVYSALLFVVINRQVLLRERTLFSGALFFLFLFLLPLIDGMFALFGSQRLATQAMLAVAVGVIAVVGFVQRLIETSRKTPPSPRIDLGARRRRRHSRRNSSMKKLPRMNPRLPKEFISRIRARLMQREKEIKEELTTLEQEDPFNDTSRTADNAELLSESSEQSAHELVAAQMKYLRSSLKAVKNALGRIRKGTYGVSEESGTPIAKERLEANPTATRTIEEEEKAESEASTQLPPMERIS